MKHATLAALLLCAMQTTANAFEHQTRLGISRDINEYIGYSADIDYRFDGDNLFHRHYDAGINSSLNFLDLGEGWNIGVNYRQIYRKGEGDDKWSLEKRPHINLKKTFSTQALGAIPSLQWMIRDRQEYRIRDGREDASRQRVMVRIKSKKPFLGVKPFVGDEVFYDLNNSEFTQNRIFLGFDFPKNDYVKSSFHLRYKMERNNDEWEPGIISTVLKIGF